MTAKEKDAWSVAADRLDPNVGFFVPLYAMQRLKKEILQCGGFLGYAAQTVRQNRMASRMMMGMGMPNIHNKIERIVISLLLQLPKDQLLLR